MQDKKYLIEIPDMPEGSGVWDADKWERNKDVFMEDYPNAQVFELGEYDEEDSRESDQILLSFEDEASSGIWDQAKWERNKYAFTKDNPEAQVSRVRYVDYWGQKAEDNRAEKAALQQPDEERNARLAEIGYYDDLSEGQRVFDLNAPNMIGLKPLSSAIDTNSVSGQTTYLDPRVQEFFANDSAYTDKMAEIARLDAEYDRNPNVIAQREWEAQQLAEQKAYAANLEKEIRENLDTDVDVVKASRGGVAKRGYDPLESQQMSYLLDKIAGDDAGSGEQENEKLERYTTSLKLLEKAKIARNVAGKGFGGAVIDWAKEGFMDAGTQDDIEAYNEIGNILTRLEKQVGSLKEENLTEEVFNQYLSKDEQALMKSFFEYNKAMADAQQDMSQSYKGGKIFAESIPFMLEFLATGGLYKGAGRAATRGLERALVNWVSKAARKTASRTARKIAAASARDLTYALAGTAARTLFTPGTYNRMAEESVKIEDGHLNRAKNAAVAAADMYVENLSEVSGGLIGKAFGWAGKGVGWLIGKTPLSKIGSVLADNKLMQSISAFMPKLEALGFHGLPEEIGEEFIGNAIREVMNIQPGALKEMVSDDNFGAMLIGFAPMTLIGAAGGAISLGVVNYEAAKLGNKMREMMSDHYSVEEMDAMMSSVQSASTAEEIQQAIKPMAMAIARASESGMITQEQAAEELETLYQWGGFMAQNNALLFSKKAQDNELANAKRAEMVDQYGRFWQEDETESVQVATLNNGSTVFVTSAPSEDGKITTIDVATGKKGFANVSDIATQEVEGEQIQSSTTMTMSAFLNGQIAMGRKTAEETRMTNERNAQIEALRAEVTPGTRINLGTEGSPINVFAKKVGNNGITIVDETGMESILGWEQAADALGKPIIVETDQQKLDAEISARLQRLAERRMQRKVTPAVENATTEAAEESAEITAQEQVHIPLNEDGTVNEAAFWTQDPEGYVKWNDEQNQDGGQDSLRQIAISKQELIGMLNEVAAGQNTSNPTMRKAAEKQVAAIAEKIARLEALEMSYADALAEEKETIKQTAATPTATMNEEQLEQMDAQYQGILGKTRIQGERVRVMQEYLDKLAENSAPIKVLTKDNYEEVMRAAGCPEEDIKRVGTAIRTSAITGAMIAGFASNGVTFVMADTIADINSARITYIHERQHLLNSQNPDVVKQFAAALGDKENALRILETFVGKNGLEEYKNDPIEKLADEIICRSMEIVYSTENYSVDLQNQGLSEEAINIINTIDNGQRTDKSFSSARRSSHANLSQRENAEENGRNSEQVSGGILDGEETGSIGSSGRGDGVGGQGSAGEGAEVDEESEEDAETILNEDGFEVDEQNEDVRFSVRYVPTPEQRESIIDSIIQTTGRTREKAERWLESELSLVPIVLNDKEYLDYAPDSKYKAIKDNSDYPQGTVDFNNICRKRKDFTRMYTRLQRAYPNRIFTAEDLADIRTIMSEDGLVVACGLCYVEDRRQKLGEVADEFIKDLQDGFKSYGKKNATKRANAEKFRSLVGEDTYVPSIYDLITLEGSDKLHDEHKGIWDAFGAYNRARGQQTQNTFQGYAEYKREILTWSDAKVKKVNSLGGLRIFSYSDFEAHHLLDIIQIIIDCAARGVMIQGYTKVPEFARVVEKTGIKLNRSLIPLGDTGIVDGKLAYDSVEGIDINDPNFLESNDNVGNILIGINDEQIRMAMADPFIHYIIPYHARQAGNIRAKLNVGAWSNYIDTQNERKMSDGKRVEKNINIYTDVLNESITNDKEFVEKYLEVCREKGYIPKFDQFLDKDAEGNYVYTPGYYKFLVDFKLFDEAGNILPQKAVVAEFDDEFNAQVLKDYAKEERENVGETMNSTYDKIVETLDLGEPTEDEDVRFKVSEGVIDLVEEARKADLRHRVAAEGTLVPGHKKGQPMLSDAEMMADVSFRNTKNTKATIETWFNKAGVDPEMTEATINYLDFAFEDTTEQLCAAKWYLNGKISLPDEDEYKVRDAVKVAKQNKVDALSYASPMDILNTFGQPKSKVKPINPDTIKEFSNKNELAEGIVVYDVQDDFEGQAAVRKIIDTHWGEDANPWCLAARVNGDLERAKDMWLHYSKYPKRIAFRNGKLLAFYASANDKTWWDRNDEPHTNIPYSVKSKEGEYEVSTNYELKEGNKKAKKVSVGKSDKKGRTAYFVGNRLESAGIQDGERNLFYSSYSMGATLSDSTYGVGRSIEIQYGPFKNVTQITFERRTKDEPTYYVRVGYGNNGVRAVSFVEGARSWDIRYGINGDQIFVGGAQLNFDLTDELSDVYSGAYHMYRINDEEYEIARGIKKVGIVKKGEKVTMQMLEAFGEDGAPAGALLDFINDMGWNRADYPYPNPMDVDLLRRDDEVREQIRKVENEINEIAGGRYLSSVPAIRFRVTAEQDKAYMDAVEAGDMETAQRMVIEAAKLAMPNTKVVDKEGNPRVVYHQTNAKVYVNRETGQNWDNLDWREKMEWDERDDWEDYWEEQDFNTFSRINARTTNEFDGFFFAPKYDEYHEYGERTISAFVNIQNPASREDYNIDSRYSDAGRKERIRLQAAGFDGVIRMEGEEVDEYIAFEPSQIKSADPVTYDNNGNVIPLSERFNPENEDIRFRVLDTTNAELKEKPIKLNGMYRFKLKNAFKGVKDNGGSYPYIKVQLEEVPEDHSGDKITYNGILEGFAVVRIPKGLITEGEKDNVFFIDPKDIENELWDVLRATENYYEFKHGSAPYQRDWINVEEVRFRMSNENQAIFVSNAAKAVEGIKQEKATPEQWLKMIEKNGGLKAGEDKWMGLSDWLKASDKKTLTKQEVLDFIKENMIVIEEQHYSNQLAYENNSMLMDEKYPGWRDAFSFEWDDYRDAPNADILDEEEATTLYNKYNEDKVEVDEDGEIVSEQDRNKVVLWGEDIAKVFFGQEGDAVRPIHDTREVYTTKGLINRHEIALTVPTIESWGKSDMIHFGDAGDGRAIAWIRFGETSYKTVSEDSAAYNESIDALYAYWDYLREKYGNGWADVMTEAEKAEEKRIQDKYKIKRANLRKKVLVIDEIQSKRHQEGREKGYKKEEGSDIEIIDDGVVIEARYNGRSYFFSRGTSRTTIESSIGYDTSLANRDGIPDAPFDKNWHELAMKRMLRYAAENGYDVIAWTKGEQQAERYGIGKVVSSVGYRRTEDGKRVRVNMRGGESLLFDIDALGKVTEVHRDGGVVTKGMALSEIVGSDLAKQIGNYEGEVDERGDYNIKSEDFRIGGEGMKGFYDKMLPAFMNKYGKKWGVKVEDIDLPNLENGLTMHSVPVTDAMKESVMEGQVMFRMRGENESAKEFTDNIVKDFKDDYNAVAPIEIVDLNSKENVARFFNIPAKDITDDDIQFIKNDVEKKDIWAAYHPDLKKIVIFVRDSLTDSKKGELALIHENIHAINGNYPEFLALGEYLWNRVEEGTKEHKYKTAIQKFYPEHKWHDELSAYVVSEHMQNGTLDELRYILDLEHTNILNKILNTSGYGKERKSDRSSFFWNVLRKRSSGKVGRASEKKGGASELTAEERRIINEYFPGAFPEEENDTQSDNTGEYSEGEGDIRFRVADSESKREIINNTEPVDVIKGAIVATDGESVSKAALRWFEENVGKELIYNTEVGTVTINRRSVKNSLAHGYSQTKLDAITSLPEGFGRAVYLASEDDFDGKPEVNHYFVYPINYDGGIHYVLCRVKSDVNKSSLYIHEVFPIDAIKGHTLQTAADQSQPHRGISLYLDLLKEVLYGKDTDNLETTNDSAKNIAYAVNENPTEAQKEAGNYKKGHLNLDGYRITIENPKGSVRRGTDSKGNAWENTLNNDYGYIRGTEGVDGDHIDMYLSDNPTEGNVFVIDQVNPETREFDEHKVMYGFDSAEEAREAYLANFSEGWNGLGTITEVSKDEFKKWIESSHRKTKPFSEYKSVRANEMQATDESELRYRVVSASETLDRLNSEPTIKVYRAMQLIDGKLYPPMSAKVDGELRQPIELGQWEEAEERPDLVDEKGRFKLDKGNKSSLKARYNPYFHTSPTPLNDQFSSAQTRPELVTVEVEVPESELTSGYKAEKAKDSVGKMEWKAGVVQSKLSGTRTVILSRWDKPVRIVPDGEVADVIVDMFEGRDITMPSNVVTPSLRAELEKRGVPFVETDNQGNPVEEVSFRVTGTPTDEVVTNGLQLTPAQTAEVAANIFAALPEESRKKITEGLNGNVLGLKDAILQIPTSLATKVNWNEEDKQMAAVVRDVLQDLVDANPTTRPLTTKEALWMLYDSTKEVKDLVDAASRAFVAYNLGFDPASMQRKKEVSDYLRFRTASTSAIDAATDMYNYETNLWTERLKESWLDMNQSVISLQKAMAETSGMPIEPWENLEFALNRLSSKSYADKKKYLRDFLIPMWDTILDIVKHDHVSIEDIERYMMLKHGLERNKKFASRDAKEFYRAMYDVVAERMKSQSHAQQVVALSEANKALADIRAKMANATGQKLVDLQEAEKKAMMDVQIADLVLRGDEKLNEQELQDYYDNIDNELDHKYREFREKDYGGLTSMFVDTTEVKRSDYKSEAAYQKAVLAATTPKFTKVADMEAEAQSEVDAFENKVYMYSSLWDKVNAATKETLRHQYESGMITIEQYEAVRDMFEFYVPLRGFADNTAEDMYSYYMSNTAGGFTKPILGAKGRKTRAESPLGWIGTMAESAIQADNKNEAKMCLYYMTLRRPDQNLLTITETWYEYTGQKDANGKKIFKAAYPPAVSQALSADDLRQHMDTWEADMKQKQSRGEAYKGSQRVDLKGSVVFQDEKEEKEHVVRVKVAGKDYSILINGNPRAAQSINGLLNPDANVGPVAQWIGNTRRNLSALLTSYSPLFWIANYQRDLLSSVMRVSEADGWDTAMKYLANRRKAWRVASYIYKYDAGTLGDTYYEKLYKEFAENGGVTGYTALTTNKEYEELLKKYANNVDKHVLNAVKGIWDKFMGFGEAIEQVSRFAAFITAREEGKSIEEAINAAKEVSVNFNRKGSAKPISLDELDKLRTKDGKELNKAQRVAALVLSAMPGPMKHFYYFVNASIQALSSSAKLAKKSPGKATTWVGMYMGTSIALAMLNYLLSDDDDDEYLNLPDYLRHSTALVKVADGYYFKWSIPQEMRPFYAWADILVRKMMGKMPHKSGADVGKEMALAASQWLPVNPFEAEDPLLSLVPDFASPFAEIKANTNAFGGKIYNDMTYKSEGVAKEIPAYRKATERTGDVYVDIAEFLNDVSGGNESIKGKININPAIMEHLIEGYGGGIYDFAKMIIALPGMLLSEDPVEIKKIPFANKVILSVDETNMYSHTNEAFYHYKDVADNAKRVEKEYRESDDPSRADAYREEEDWRIYLLYKEYEKDFKDVKERLDNAVDKEEEDLLKQEQNVLREMFLNDIAKGEIPEVTFQIREDIKRIDKEVKAVMKPVMDANKERIEMRKAGNLDGMLKAIEKRDSLKKTPEYQRAEKLNRDLKAIKRQLEDLKEVARGAQRDSVIGELQQKYDALIQKMDKL